MGRRLVLALACLAAAATAGAAWAAYTATTSNPTSTITAQRIYPAERSWSAFKVADASSGTESDKSAALSYAGDGLVDTTGNWASTFATTRYVDFDYNAPLAAGLAVSNPKLNVRILGNGGPETICYYVELRRASTDAVVASYGSSGAPLDCETGTTYATVSTPLPALTDTDLANDLRIRLYAQESNNRPAKLDLLTVTGTYYGTVFTLHPQTLTDASTGTPAASDTWGVAVSGDSSAYQSAGNWNSSFASNRYVKFTFPTGYIPAAATITSVTLDHAYRSATSGDNTCWYFETYSGTTLLGTHGSAASPVNCNSSASFVTDSVSLPEVDQGSKAQGLVVKIYISNSGKRKTQHDLVRLRVAYSLGPAGCVDPGVHTYDAIGDSWIQQDNATSNNGTATTLQVKANLNKNRRTLVIFDLPSLPTDCSLTSASLRLYVNATQGARTVNASQIASAWTENAVTWNNQPTTTGTPASATTGIAGTYTTWTVTSLVQAMMTGTNYGFMIVDAAEDSGNITQTFQSRENTNPPQLDLTFG